NIRKREISEFIERTVNKELVEKETKLVQEYQRAYQNPHLLKLEKNKKK
ncbi:25050_t:CDS:1, partial [Racocetra persica]